MTLVLEYVDKKDVSHIHEMHIEILQQCCKGMMGFDDEELAESGDKC